MKKLSIICVLALVLGLMVTPTFALEFKFDFYGGDTCYTQGDFEYPQDILICYSGTVMIDIWLVDWPTDRLNIGAVDYYLQWDTYSLDVVSVTCNNLKPNGQWDDEYHLEDTNEYALGVAEYSLGVPGPDVLLHTAELHGYDAVISPIMATLGEDGVVLNVNGDEFTDVTDGDSTLVVT